MSLLDDLQAIDLSGIVSAKGSIKLAVGDTELTALITAGPAQAALAGLGTALAEVEATLASPEALIAPIARALQELAERILPDDLPLADYAQAVRQAAEIIAKLLDGIDGDPAQLGRVFGFSVGEIFDSAKGLLDGFQEIGFAGMPRFAELIANVEAGGVRGPTDFAQLAIEVLLPFPKEPVLELRGQVDLLLEGLGSVSLPGLRSSGLVAVLDQVRVAAEAGDDEGLRVALAALAKARANTIGQLEDDLRGVFSQVDGLRVPDVFGRIAGLVPDLSGAEHDVLAFLDEWRRHFASVRAGLDGLDAAQITALWKRVLDELETQARSLEARVDEQVLKLGTALRGLFAELPIGRLRQKITNALQAVAKTVQDAGIESVAESILGVLEDVRAALAGDLAGEARAALEDVQLRIEVALDELLGALDAIAAAVDAVAGGAQEVLGRAAAALASFQGALDGIQAAVEGLGIDAAAEQVVGTLSELRATAEELLSVAPLPEPMRPIIDQMVATLEGLDFDVVFAPVHASLAELQVPADVTARIEDVLSAAAEAVAALIPEQLVEEIDAEVGAALELFRGFDPAALLGGVGEHLAAAVERIRALAPSPAVAQAAHEPFQRVLDALDAVQPAKLLAPVIEIWDETVGQLRVPGHTQVMTGLRELVDRSGSGFTAAVAAPVAGVEGTPSGAGRPSGSSPGSGAGAPPAGPGSGAGPGSDAGSGAGAEPATELQLSSAFKPGDIVRMFGYLPQKLRGYLRALPQTEVGPVVAQIDRLCGGLARDLRAIPARVRALESRVDEWLDETLEPLRQSQLGAQLAVDARLQTGGVALTLDVSALAAASPGALRDDLAEVRTLIRQIVERLLTGTGSIGAAIDGLATLLERCSLAGLAGDAEALLAALDPEPIAAEMDAFAADILGRAPALLSVLEVDLRAALERFQGLLAQFNPGTLAQRFLALLDVLKEQVDLFDPRRLAAELGEIHAAVRAAVAAYDPARFVEAVGQVIGGAADGLAALDPAALLGDLTFLDATIARIEAANPARALEATGVELAEVGAALTTANPGAMLEAIGSLGPEVAAAVERAIEGIRDEIVLLLKSIQFASAQASASLEVSVG